MKYSRFFAIVGLLAVLAMPARADVLVSNLAEPLRDFNIINSLLWAAQSFETDANTYALTNIMAIVGNETAAAPAGAFAQLRSSTASGDMDLSAGGLLLTFALPDLSGPRSARTFAGAALNLAASTRYFFMLGAAGPGSYQWSYAEGNGSVGPGSFGPYEYTFDGGATWGTFGTDNPFHMQVNVTSVSAVPEPASGMLLFGSAIGLILLRRKVAN